MSREGRDHQVISVASVQLLPCTLSGKFLRLRSSRDGSHAPKRRGPRFAAQLQRNGAPTAACAPADKAEFDSGNDDAKTQFLTYRYSSCESRSPISLATERSNPIRGPESEAEDLAGAHAPKGTEEDERRAQQAGGSPPPAARSEDGCRKAVAFALAMTALVPSFFNLRSFFPCCQSIPTSRR